MNRTKNRAQALLESLSEVRSQTTRLARRIEYLESKCTNVTARYTLRTGSGGGDTTDVWCQLSDERERLAAQLQKLLALYRQVEQWIDLLPNPGWRMVLRYRYLDGLTLPQTAEAVRQAMGKRSCSDSQIYRLHKEALEAANRLWPMEQNA